MEAITIQINDVDLDVTFSYWPYQPATLSDPAEGGELEIECVHLDGKKVERLAAHIMDEIHQKVRAAIDATSKRQDEAEAEAKIDAAVAYLGYA